MNPFLGFPNFNLNLLSLDIRRKEISMVLFHIHRDIYEAINTNTLVKVHKTAILCVR